jgi:Zn-dependent M32 family carboxypeptidase
MVGNLLDRAEQAIESFENQWQKANLREMQRIHSLYSAVPEELQCEIASQAIITETAWRKAKETNDYPLFSSSMAPLLDLVRRWKKTENQAFPQCFEDHIPATILYTSFPETFFQGILPYA